MKRCAVISRVIMSLVMLVALATTGFAQANLGLYNFSNVGSLPFANAPTAPLTGGTLSPGVNQSSAALPIGITGGFWFNGVNYTHVRISSNGWVALGRNASDFGTFPSNAGFDNTILQQTPISIANPIIAPLWDNFAQITGEVSYASTATNFRVLWRNVNWEGAAGVSFELELRSTGNEIRFRYYNGGNFTATQGAVVGIVGPQATTREVRLLTGTAPLTFTNDRQNIAAYSIDRIDINSLAAGDALSTTHYPALIVTNPVSASLNFGNVISPTSTATQSFSLLNIGGTAVTLTNTDLVLTGSARFTLPAFNASIAAGATQVVNVNYASACPVTPSATGTVGTAPGFVAATIVYPAGASNIALSATEIAPNVSAITLANPDFDINITIGSTVSSNITITNNGGAAYVGTLTLPAALSSVGFTLSQTALNIPAGGSQVVQLQFTPTAAAHAAAANTTTWVANYAGTITLSANPCGAATPSLSVVGSSVAPRILVNRADAPNVVIPRLVYGPAPGAPLAVGTMPINTKSEVLEFRNIGSAPVTISSVTIAPNTLSNRFSANLVTPATIPAGASANVTVTYTPQATTNDFPWSAEAVNATTVANDILATAQWTFTTQPATAQAGFWVNALNAPFATPAVVNTSISIGRGLLRAVLANVADNTIAPSIINAGANAGRLSVDGGATLATDVNATNRLTISSAWGRTGDVLPGGAVIANAATTKGTGFFWVVNNGNATANYYVPTSFAVNSPFTISNPGTNPGTGLAPEIVTIGGVNYARFSLEPLAVDPARARFRVAVNFDPNAANVANPSIAPSFQENITILTDANLPTTSTASTNILASYTVGVTGTILFPDPVALVYTNDAATADRTVPTSETFNFGTHELGNVSSSTFPFLGGGPIAYNAPSEVLNRIFNNVVPGYTSAFARAKALYGMGVRDTVVTFRLRNRGNQGLVFNSLADITANAVAIGAIPSPGTFSAVFVAASTQFAGYPAGFTSAAPASTITFPFTLQPNSGNELIVWVRYDAGDRVTGSLFNNGVSNGEFRTTSRPAADNVAQVRLAYNLTGRAIRPFPVVSNTNMAPVYDPAYSISKARMVPARTTRGVKLDNWCGTLTQPNRDADTVVVELGNGFPLPTSIGNVNNDAISAWTFTLNAANFNIIKVLDDVDGDDSVAYGEAAPSFTIVTGEPAQVVFQNNNAVVTTANWGSTVTLQAGQVLRVKVAYRPVGIVTPGLETALIRFTQTANRNNTVQNPAETGASHTGNFSEEKGDVFRHLDYVVNGITTRAALRVELSDNGDYVMPGALGAGVNFNLPYPYTPGIFVGDSNFVSVNLAASASNSLNVTPAQQMYDNMFVSGVGIKSIEIIGEDAEDFEIVGFNLPAGVTEPHPVLYGFEDPAYAPFPIMVPTAINSEKASKLQWTIDLNNGISIGRPFTLDRNATTAAPESVRLVVHFRPRKIRNNNGNLDLDVRTASLRIETNEPCIGTDGIVFVNLSGRPLSADVRVVAGATNDTVRFGVVQVNDVDTEEVVVRNFGNYPAHFVNRFQATATNIVPIDIPFQKFLNFSNRAFYLNNFSTVPLGFRLDQSGNSFAFIGDTLSVLNPNQQRTIAFTFAPSAPGRKDAGFTLSYIPDVNQRLENENVVGLRLVAQGAQGSRVVFSGEKVTEDTLNFGNVAVGGNASTVVRVTNVGDAAVEVSLPLNLLGSPFSHNPENITVTIPARGFVDVNFTFAPRALGAASNVIEIDGTNAFGGPMTLRLHVRGNGVIPVTATPANGLNFGVTRVFSDSTMSFTLTNGVAVPVTLSNARLSGASASSFSIVSGANSISANGTATMSIKYSPTVLPATPGDVVFDTSAVLLVDVSFTVMGNVINQTLSIPVRGTAGVPQIAFEETEDGDATDGVINFRGGVTSRRFVVRNVGRFPLEVTQVQIVGVDANQFALAQVPQRRVLGFNESFEGVVNYLGTSQDVDSARIVAISNTQQQRSVDLAGTAAAARLTLSASNVNFGNVAVNTTVNRTLTITNNSGDVVRINELTFGNASNNDYVITGKSKSLPAELANGETLTITLAFEPRTVGDKSQRLLINSSVEQSEVSLFGRAVSGQLTMAQSLNFGNVVVGGTRKLSLMVRNSGTADITVQNVAVEGENASMFYVNTQGFTVLAGETKALEVTFTPNSRGMKNAIAIVTPEIGAPLQAVLFGAGGAPALSVAQTLSFGNTAPETVVERELNFSNTGDAELIINEARLSGLHNGDFEVLTQMPITVAPGQLASIRIRFVSSNSGDRNAVLTLNSNTGVPASVELLAKVTPTSVDEPSTGFALAIANVVPNPVTESATVTVRVDRNRAVSLKLYNNAGAEVATLISNTVMSAGEHTVRLQATSLASGTYFLRLESGETTATVTVTIVK